MSLALDCHLLAGMLLSSIKDHSYELGFAMGNAIYAFDLVGEQQIC